MKIPAAITPPVWIFGLTLLAIVATGGLVGTSPCDRVTRDCLSKAAQAHPDNTALQQAFVGPCAESACRDGKSGAIVPFTILILGAVVYFVWSRQAGPVRLPSSAGTGSAPSATREPVPATAASKPAVARRTSMPTPSEPTPGAPAPAAAPATPSAAHEPVAAPSTGKSDGLTTAQRKVLLSTFHRDETTTKDTIAANVAHILGTASADAWKAPAMDDLDLLARALAVAALFGPAASKYRRGLDAPGLPPEARLDVLNASTKKALHAQCLETLRRDLAALAAQPAYPVTLSADAVQATVQALQQPDALAGLSRCSKAALVELAAFLEA